MSPDFERYRELHRWNEMMELSHDYGVEDPELPELTEKPQPSAGWRTS